jgi:hypothetical protein
MYRVFCNVQDVLLGIIKKRGDDCGSQKMVNGFRDLAGFGGVCHNGIVEGSEGSDNEHGGYQAHRDYAL